MASYTELNNKIRLVHDLVWLQADEEDDESVRTAAGEARQIAKVVNSYGTVMVGQYLPKLDGQAKGKKLVSFAALMALHLKDEHQALVCMEIGPGVAAMVGVIKGLPVPDTDRYGLREDIIRLAQDFILDYPEASVHGNLTELEPQRLQPLDMTSLLQTKSASAILRAAQIRPLSGSSRLTWVLLLCLVLFSAYVGYDYLKNWLKPPPAVQQPVKKTPEQIYAEGLKDAIRQQGMTVSLARAVVQAMRARPMSIPGWRVSSLSCGSATCSAIWVRSSPTSSFADITQALGNELQLRSDQTVQQTLIVNAQAADDAYPNPQTLPDKREAWVSVFSPLQKTGGSLAFTIANVAAFPVQGLTPPGSIYANQLSLNGKVWIDSFFDTLPGWAMVREFTYSFEEDSENATFNAKIVLFTKN
ncbi:MAG: type 4b pilus protein PilO2 [Burkholderiales bacterium]